MTMMIAASCRLSFSILVFTCIVLVTSRHVDMPRDYSRCAPGTIPIAIKNNDGFLQITCIRPKCEEINKVQAVCTPTFAPGCTKGSWVGEVHREYKEADEKSEYKCKCCSHPIFSKTVSIKPQLDFPPGREARDAAAGQGDIIDIVTNVMHNPRDDVYGVEITSVLCHGSTTTARSTVRPSTAKPRNDNHNTNTGNNGGGGGGGGTGSNNGGEDGGHGGDGHGGDGHGGDGGHGGSDGHGGGGSHGGSDGHGGGGHGCGETGCSQPELEGGEHKSYHPQHAPKPNQPPPGASDPKAWGADTAQAHAAGGGGAGCFSADTMVRTRLGTKRMDEIRVGDEILSSISWDGNSAASYQPITQFIHKDPSVFTQYTVISTATGRTLSLTPYHLLPQFECHLVEDATISAREYELLFTRSAKFANRARTGQCVLVVDERTGGLVPERIANVTRAIRRGVYSPITATGIIVANGVQASCYSSVENHALQHAFFTIMQKISRSVQPYVDYAANLLTWSSSTTNKPMSVQSKEDDTQIPYLLRIMLVLTNMVVGSF